MKSHTEIINKVECISGKQFMLRAFLNPATFTRLVKEQKINFLVKGVHKFYPVSQLAQFGGK